MRVLIGILLLSTSALGGYSPATTCEYRANTPSGNGSTDTAIRRMTNELVNTGSCMTGVSNSTNGTKVTINTAGTYAVEYVADQCNGCSGGAVLCGISLNATTTTNASGLTTTLLGYQQLNGDVVCNVSWVGRLAVNDVVRPHVHSDSSTYNNSTSARVQFRVTYIGP